mmetsp:Transcript_58665/g.132206  ORF Transcript_58665/g.132206 Transcript_58665/m.132206 type:complete len:314 (+) Transcript_58665:80-1021(+)
MAEPGGGGTDLRLAALCITLLLGIFGALAYLVLRAGGEEAKPEAKATGGQRRRGALDRMQRDAARGTASSTGQGRGDSADAEDDDDDDGQGAGAGDRAARRNVQKQQKKQEKREQQHAERDARQQRETGKQEKQQKYSEKQQQKEAERQKKEEEERKAKESKAKQEQADFDKWKDMFAVDAEGEQDAADSSETTVGRFIDYVKMRKVVNLEDIAADFQMKTSAAIDRLERLQELGRLSGIFDDRGKFVFITPEEMTAVADWLKKKGRINRADLVAGCNRLIRLNPTEEDKAKLQQEAHSAAEAEDARAEVSAS